MNKLWKLLHLFQKRSHTLKPEALEQAKFVLWLEQNGYTYTAIPNATWTQSIKQKIVNIMTWVSPWLCDMLIVLKRWSLLFLEMKLPWRKLKNWKIGASPSKISPEQKEWIEILWNIDNVWACVCNWCDESIKKVLYYEEL